MADRVFENGERNGQDVVDAAAHRLGMEMHHDIVGSLEPSFNAIPLTMEDRMQYYYRHYPELLFGELAMHIAGVELRPNATPPDRARGIIEAMRRISTVPRLFEAVTNAPYSQELAEGTKPKLANKVVTAEDAETLEKVKHQIAAAGFVEAGMIPEGRMLQLEYRPLPFVKKHWWNKPKFEDEGTFTLKLVPNPLSWEIRRYKKYIASDYGRRYKEDDFMDTRTEELNLFTLSAIDTDKQVPEKLADLVGKNISIGIVTRDSDLSLRHNYSMAGQEYFREPNNPQYKTLKLPAKVLQAYLGDSLDCPLFT